MTMAATAYIVLALCALANGAFLRRPDLDGRIIGGEDAEIEDYPYQLSLLNYGSHICGASIISDYWVLTAAHCIDGQPALTVNVRAGSSKRGQGGKQHQVDKIIKHELYNRNNVDYDFALLKVRIPFEFELAGIKPIALVDSEPVAGEIATITGWGRLSPNGKPPTQLQVVNVPMVSRTRCLEVFKGITDRMICAGVDVGSKDACQGDSGGPMVVDGKLAGVVSWGVDCGTPGYPGVYSNIANQRAWIRENSGI